MLKHQLSGHSAQLRGEPRGTANLKFEVPRAHGARSVNFGFYAHAVVFVNQNKIQGDF
jgi:hypothetical protein